MKLFRITLFSCLLACFAFYSFQAKTKEEKKYVFAINNLRFLNTPEYGILSHINAENYHFDQDHKNWVKNNELFYPIDTDLVSPLTLEDAVDLEINLAMKSGINGFSLLYILSENRKILDLFDHIIDTYVKVIQKKGYDFKLMIAIKFEFGADVHQGIYECGTRLAKIYDQSKDFKNWYTINGNKALMFYKSKGLTSLKEIKKWEKSKDSELDMSAYFDRIDEITSYLSKDISVIYNAFWPGRKREIELALERFETIYFEKSRMLRQKKIDLLASILKSKQRPFIQTVMHSGISSYFVHNSDHKKKPVRHITSNKMKINECYKEYDNLHLSRGIRDGFKSAMKHDAEIVMLDSWNTFLEHSHFRPSYNNGWGLSVLLNSYIDEFNHRTPEESMVMVYLPKQNEEDKSYLMYKNRKSYSYKDPNFEKKNIEIVTYLDAPAELYFRNSYVKTIPEGRQVTHLAWKGGSTDAFLKRNGARLMDIKSPKKVCSVKDRNNPVKVYLSNKDPELYANMISMLAEKEVNFFKHRFLLSDIKYQIWVGIEKKKMEYYISNLVENEKDMKVAFSKIKKYEKGYKAKIKDLLSPFNYKIWEEIISEKMEYAKPLEDYDIYDFENSYNLLQAY
ncbi:hypothetical protein [Flammeovirga sp. OC4]|uniref:hypothetical protein n=1 Tax=Flammeovirga sp. OC4 TaxID=1382345 RepID=UPI0005C6B5A1|nr:hypothetical protein [Flammeovirga sp. OC4]